MLINLIIWGSILYLLVVVLWRLFVSIIMIIEGWGEAGVRGAIVAALMSFLINVWDLTKFIISVLVIAFIIKACFK